MAFYRCDRGLGFDTSNSTGTENDVLYSKKFNNGNYYSGTIKNGVYALHNISISNFEMILKFQALCNTSKSTTKCTSLILSPNRYSTDTIRIPGTTSFDSNTYKNAIYGMNGNSELKFINKSYKKILDIPQKYNVAQLYFEKSNIQFSGNTYTGDIGGAEYDNSNFGIRYNSWTVSYSSELINQLCNIAQSEGNIEAISELMNINPDDIYSIFKYAQFKYLISPAFVHKTTEGDIYIYKYYNNNANNIESTKIILNLSESQSDNYPGISKLFSDNEAFYIHEPYVKITNDGNIAHLPIISTNPNPNIIFAMARITSFQSSCAISNDGIYDIYSSLQGLYFRKYNLDYEVITETKINTDQFYLKKYSGYCINIKSVSYYDNNIIFTNSGYYGYNIVSLDYDGNIISILAYHYNESGINTRCLRVECRNEYIGIFTSNYTYYSYTNDLRYTQGEYSYLVDNDLLTTYDTYENLECLKYTELNPHNLDIIYSIEYDNRYILPYNIKFGIRSYLGINRGADDNFYYLKYTLNSTKKPLLTSVYNSSTEYLVNIKDSRSIIIYKDSHNYIVSCCDCIYLLNDYDTNYDGYNIDNTNESYTDYYFN